MGLILDMLKNMLTDPQAKAKVQRITPLSVVKSAVEFLEQYNITTLSKLQKTLANTETKIVVVVGYVVALPPCPRPHTKNGIMILIFSKSALC